MKKFWVTSLLWIVFLGFFWLAGARYGAPSWLTGVSDRGFAFAETAACHLKKRVFAAASTADPDSPTANANIRINKAGLDIIKMSEGLRLEAYEAGGKLYIGYAHQMRSGEPRTITEDQADRLLRQDVGQAEDVVRKTLTRPATENQFSAMVSLAYNLGAGGFGGSQVHVKFNDGDISGAADAFLTHNRSGGVVLEHLTDRRQRERALFLTS